MIAHAKLRRRAFTAAITAALSWLAASAAAESLEAADYGDQVAAESPQLVVLPEPDALTPVYYEADLSGEIPEPVADDRIDPSLPSVLDVPAAPDDPNAADDLDSLLDMADKDIGQLGNVAVANPNLGEIPDSVTLNTGTLTATAAAPDSPSTVTHITHEMIQKSGARTLDEVFDIFVPNLQVIRHHGHYSHVGIRGIISDREDKYLLRVNGRIMNNRFVVGADSERNLPLLRDIDYVDVIRGSGSPTYGAGAIAGVISVTTFNGTTFEGLDANIRQGFEQRMTTTEMRWGKHWGDETGAFIYYGYADQPGANSGDSPYVFPRTATTPNGFPNVVAGQPSPLPTINDEGTLFGKPEHKLHVQFTHDTWDFWARYTKGSYFNPNQESNLVLPPYGSATAGTNLFNRPGVGDDYQQLTFFGSKILELSDTLTMSAVLSYDFYDWAYYRLNAAVPRVDPVREDEVYGRIMGQWVPNDVHSFALGYEHSFEHFGLDTGLSDQPTRGQRLNFINSPWETNTASVFGEYRWKMFEPLTTILSGRLDDHTYSHLLVSPRISVMLRATEADLVKFNIGQSVRKPGDEELRAQIVANGTIANEEVIRGSEIRWERAQTEHLKLATSMFHQNHDVVGFSGSLNRSDLLGTFESWGFECEGVYDMGANYFTISHGYVDLLHAHLVDPNLIQAISAMPYGFGSDFANWSNNVTKFAVARNVTDDVNLSTSLRVYWGFPGAEDLAAYNNTLPTPSAAIAQSDPGYTKASRANYYLDMGYQHRWSEHITWRADLYNVLGWIDIDLNKRNYINRVTEYRSDAAAAGLSATVSY